MAVYYTPTMALWTDLDEMFEDMIKFGREHPTHTIIPMDDPGKPVWPPVAEDGSPNAWEKPPTIGFSAYDPANGQDEKTQTWGIRMHDLVRCLRERRDAGKDDPLRAAMSSGEGRRALCQILMGKDPPQPVEEEKDDPRQDLLDFLPHLRIAIEMAKLQGGKPELAILSTNPDGSGQIVARFETAFVDDLGKLLGDA